MNKSPSIWKRRAREEPVRLGDGPSPKREPFPPQAQIICLPTIENRQGPLVPRLARKHFEGLQERDQNAGNPVRIGDGPFPENDTPFDSGTGHAAAKRIIFLLRSFPVQEEQDPPNGSFANEEHVNFNPGRALGVKLGMAICINDSHTIESTPKGLSDCKARMHSECICPTFACLGFGTQSTPFDSGTGPTNLKNPDFCFSQQTTKSSSGGSNLISQPTSTGDIDMHDKNFLHIRPSSTSMDDETRPKTPFKSGTGSVDAIVPFFSCLKSFPVEEEQDPSTLTQWFIWNTLTSGSVLDRSRPTHCDSQMIESNQPKDLCKAPKNESSSCQISFPARQTIRQGLYACGMHLLTMKVIYLVQQKTPFESGTGRAAVKGILFLFEILSHRRGTGSVDITTAVQMGGLRCLPGRSSIARGPL
ncbi:hypothetical protein FB45DRAFT_874080 [Roridomyces roridus]|uniref:Uncharacterized protein n=1 Tax=Roridomyces roridus TaxID=1738132 RepID=A0AAD7BA67_9AGAR|nr:hypothetical protein FB45DRAFT_874080 [Roridomyces roridus]